VKIGLHAFIAGGALVTQDVPPYCTAHGDRAKIVGLNTVGLTRAGYTADQIGRIKAAYRSLFRSKLGLREAIAHVRAEHGGHQEIDHLLRFVEGSERGIAR
jgi:UDP-N-acetylglucosamine acyltransferase